MLVPWNHSPQKQTPLANRNKSGLGLIHQSSVNIRFPVPLSLVKDRNKFEPQLGLVVTKVVGMIFFLLLAALVLALELCTANAKRRLVQDTIQSKKVPIDFAKVGWESTWTAQQFEHFLSYGCELNPKGCLEVWGVGTFSGCSYWKGNAPGDFMLVPSLQQFGRISIHSLL